MPSQAVRLTSSGGSTVDQVSQAEQGLHWGEGGRRGHLKFASAHAHNDMELKKPRCLLQAISLHGAQGSTEDSHCLLQVIRGAENCLASSEEDVHSVLRQYRSQQGSKPSAEGPCVNGQFPPSYNLIFRMDRKADIDTASLSRMQTS